MALIEDLQEVPMDRNRVHDVTETLYCIFTDLYVGGEKRVQSR